MLSLSRMSIVLFLSLVSLPLVSSKACTSKLAVATIHNFNPDDLLNGNDGMPPHPLNPLRYGKPVLHIDVDGNGIEEHANSISFFNNKKYYMYTEAWSCGRISFFPGRLVSQSPPPGYNQSRYPDIETGGQCGILTCSSPDLTSWKLEDVYLPTGFELTLNKPRVVYSPKTKKYNLWYSAGNALRTTGGFWVATSDSPAGPWSAPTQATGPNLAHDYDISQAPDGSYWIVTDVFSGEFVGSDRKPYWNLWVQKLNEECNGMVASNETSVEIMHSVDWQAVAFSNRNGWWYITSSTTCSNCQVPTRYIRARSPLGPWETETGARDFATLNEGTLLTADGCTGQNKDASQMPSPDGGEDIVLTFIWGIDLRRRITWLMA